MQLRRYTCRNVNEALRQIRRELGPRAVVVGTREIPPERGSTTPGRRPLVEVVAAIDRDEGNPVAAPRPRPPAPANANLPPLGAVRAGRDGSQDAGEQRLRWLIELLREAGLDRRLASSVVAELAAAGELDPAALRPALIRVLARRLKVASPPWHTSDARVAYYVGPPGAGKSTTLAKVAAFAAFQEKVRVALVSTDTDRPGTAARLEALGDVMGLAVRAAHRPCQLREVVENVRDQDLILVDTAPMGAGSPSRERLAALLAAVPGRRYLCIGADTATPSALRQARRYAKLGIDAIIATRVDQAASCGSVYSITQALDRPLALLGTGAQVPEHAEVVHAESFCQRIMGPSGETPRQELRSCKH